MKNTIIGIVSKPINGKESLWEKQKITDDFRKILVDYDVTVIGVLPTNKDYNLPMNDEEKNRLNDILNLCDGIILQGGWQSGLHEIYVASYAIENDIPILGACCGFNNMLFSQKDKVQEQKDESHNVYDKDYRHEIQIEKNSRLYKIIGTTNCKVNSIHNVIAKDNDIKHFNRVAHDLEGNVEAIELPEKRFCLGVKWHPEIMTDDNRMQNIFKEFVSASNKRKEQRNIK